jgi:transcriptional regulator with XRE-family HTH domain
MNRDQSPVKGQRGRDLNQSPQRLRRRRVAARLSLTELADKAGCSAPYLSQLERGIYSASAEMLGKVADALGCEITDLMPPELAAAS